MNNPVDQPKVGELTKAAKRVLARVEIGKVDLRTVAEAMGEKWDQDFPRALLEAALIGIPGAQAIGPTYYTEGKDADWFEGLDDAEFAKRASHAAMDIADGDFDCIENYVPVVAIISLAADRITRLLALPQPQATTVGVKALELADFVVGTPVRAPGRNEKGIISDLTADGRAFVDYPAGGGKYWPLDQLQSWNGHRDDLGRQVRAAWIKWAMTQPAPKASWLVPYDQLSEPDKEADRQIGEAISLYSRSALIGIPGAEKGEPISTEGLRGIAEGRHGVEDQSLIRQIATEALAARLAAPTSERVQALEAMVERAFRDGLSYATNVTLSRPEDHDLAWFHSRARAALKATP